MSGRLLLLDAPSIYFRSFHGIPESVTAPDGSPVNAIRGLIDAVARLVTDHRPTRVVACMDADWRPAFRVAALPSYKAHRLSPEGAELTPAALGPQVPVIEVVLAAVGIATFGVPGYEADDVIGALAVRDPGPVDVVTGDRDLFQLVRDSPPVTRVLYTARGMAKLAIVDEAEVTRRYGIPGRAYADFAALRGDPSDGLPGVPGVGEKSAAALVTRFGSVEGILAAADEGETGFPAGSHRRITAARDYLAAALPVVRVVTDLPLPAYDDTLPTEPRDPAQLVELSQRWGLDGPLNRLLRALTNRNAGAR